MRSGTWKPARIPKYTLDYHKHKRLRNIRNVQINLFFAHNLKAHNFPLWLVIHLFVDLFFIASGAEGTCLMCSHGSLYKRGRKAASAFRSKGGEGDMSAYLWLHCKSLWLILWDDEKGRILKKKKPKVRSGLRGTAHFKNCLWRHLWQTRQNELPHAGGPRAVLQETDC